MEKFIIIENEESDFKNILISNDTIKALENNLETQDEFEKSFPTLGNGVLDSKDDFELKQIESLSTFNDDFGVQIKYKKDNGKTETTFYEFDTAQQKEEIKQFLVDKAHLKQRDSESEVKSNLPNRWLIYFVVSISMLAIFFTLELPSFSSVIMISIFLGLGYWVKLGQTKKDIIEEMYFK